MEPWQRLHGVVGTRGDGLFDLIIRAREEPFEEGEREPAFADIGDSKEHVCADYGDDGGGGDLGMSIRGGQCGVQWDCQR